MVNFLLGIFDGICSIFGKIVAGLLEIVSASFGMNQFIPSMDFFRETMIGTIFSSSGTAGTDIPFFDFFKHLGIYAALIIFALTFVDMIIDGMTKGEIKQYLPTTFARFILASVLIFISPQIVNFVSDTTTQAYDAMEDYMDKRNKAADSAVANSISQSVNEFEGDLKDDAATEAGTILGVTIAGGAAILAGGAEMLPILLLAFLLLKLLMLLFIAFFYFKLLLELVRRYASWVVLGLTFPAVCSTIVSYKTEEVFKKYVSSLLSTSICLVATHFFLRCSTLMMQRMPLNLVNTIFVIAWLSIGISLDQWMKDHGFTLSTAGAGIGQALLSGARDMTIVGGAAMKGAGGGLLNAAGFTNNSNLARFANSMMGGGFSKEAGLKAMGGSLGYEAAKELDSSRGLGAAVKGMTGGKVDVGSKGTSVLTPEKARTMDALWREGGMGGNSALSKMFNDMNRDDQLKWLNDTVKPRLMATDQDNGLANRMGINNPDDLELQGVDTRGRVTGHVKNALGECEVAIGTNRSSSSDTLLSDSNGDDVYASFGSFTPAQLGEGGIAVSDITGVANSEADDFTGSMSHNVLNNSAIGYMPNVSVDHLDSVKSLAGGSEFAWDDSSAVNDARNYRIGSSMVDGNAATSYSFSSFDNEGNLRTIERRVENKNRKVHTFVDGEPVKG